MPESNDVTIRIKVTDQSAAGLRSARTTAAREGEAAGQAFTQGLGAGLGGVGAAVSGSGIGAAVSGVGSAFGELGSATGGLFAAIAGIPGVISGAVGSLGNLAGAALLIPGAFSMAAAAVAAFQIGTGGVMDAISAGVANQDHPSGGGGGGGGAATKIANAKAIRAAQDQIVSSNQALVKANQQVEAAERGVATAERGVATAERAVIDAKHQVITATQSYEDSLHAEAEAQQAVQAARESAQRQLEDSIEAVKDAALGQLGADIALARAQQNLIDTQRNTKSTSLDLRDAQYQVQVAQDGVTDAATTAQRAQEDNTEAQAKGVDGADAVVSANDALHSSQEGVASSAYALQQAQQGVADAQQGVVDANQNVEDAQGRLVDAQQNVVDSQHKADEAVQNLSDTLAMQAAAMSAAGGSANKYRQDLALLSPEAQKFVKAIMDVRPAWQDLSNRVQDGLFKGFSDDVRELGSTYIPVLKDGLGGIADSMNGMAQYAEKALMKPENVQAVSSIMDDTKQFFDGAKTAVGDFIDGFLGMSKIGAQYLPGIGTWLSGIARDFKDWVQANPDKINDFIQGALTALGQIKDIGGNLVRLFAGIFEGSSGEGTTFLGVVKDVTGFLADHATVVKDLLLTIATAWAVSKVVGFASAVGGVISSVDTLASKILGLPKLPVPAGGGAGGAAGGAASGAAGSGGLMALGGAALIGQTIFNNVIAPKLGAQAAIAIKLNLDPKNAQLQLASVLQQIQGSTAAVTLDGKTMPAEDALGQVIAAINNGQGTVTLNGQSIPAKDALDQIVASINSGGGTVTINGQTIPAGDALRQIMGQISGSRADATIGANTAPFFASVSDALNWAQQTVTVSVRAVTSYVSGIFGHASGGPTGSGLALVGEQGRELVKLPSGSSVIPHGQSESMLAGGGGSGGSVQVTVSRGSGGDDALADAFLNLVRIGRIDIKAIAA